VQDARKAAALDVSDRIRLRIDATGDAAEALAAWGDYIAEQTLAAEINAAEFTPLHATDADGWSISLAKA